MRYGERSCITRRIILATGIEDRLPDMPDIEPAIHAGKVRLCAICDGYEVDGDNVAVYGEAESAITHAVFLRTFTDRVTVVVHGDQAACEQAIALAEHYAIRVIGDRVESMQPCENGIDLLTCRGDGTISTSSTPAWAHAFARSWRCSWVWTATNAAV